MENRRPFEVCACWLKHPENGRTWRIGTHLLPDLPLNSLTLEKLAKEAETYGKEPQPDYVFIKPTSIYD